MKHGRLQAIRLVSIVSIWLISTAAIAWASDSDGAAIRRFALLIGANNGGPGRTPLQFAVSDTRAFANVLYEIGGLEKSDSLLALNPNKPEVDRDIARLKAMVASVRGSGVRSEFVLYYSGHSDENGLLLNGELLSYRELRDDMATVGAELSMAILDSCASGAFIRLKGGQRVAPFLLDDSTSMKGQVYLTSSSENEASQESDTIGGSFFTNALVTGLRGAADYSLDGKVTLSEAYQFAQAETLANTENTLAGPQHPAWQIDLTGTGDLVLTDLRAISAGIIIGADVTGRLSIRDDHQALIAELRKSSGLPLSLAVPPGRYTVTTVSGNAFLAATVVLPAGGWMAVSASDFRSSPLLTNRTRGDDASGSQSTVAGSPAISADAPDRTITAGEFGQQLSDLVGKFVNGIVSPLNQRKIYSPATPAEAADPPGTGGAEKTPGTSGDSLVPGSAAATTDTAIEQRTGSANGLPSRPNASDQTGGAEYRTVVPLSVQFVPYLGFPFQAERSLKILSLNLVVGMSYEIGGVDLGGVINIVERNVFGAELAGVGNIVGKRLVGVQLAGVFNVVSGDVGYVQGAGVLNVANGTLDGVQSSGVVNYAGSVRGAQFAVVNVTGTMQGIQAGVVNVARKADGLQIGLVNVATSGSVVPVGLVNIVPNGFVSLTGARDQTGFYDFSLASGRTLYSLFGFGTDAIEASGGSGASAISGKWHVASSAGVGVRLPVGPFFAAADLSGRWVQSFDPVAVSAGSSVVTSSQSLPFPRLGARVGLSFFRTIGIFGGAVADVLYDGVGASALEIQGNSAPYDIAVGSATLHIFPKIVFGVEVKF